MKKTVFAIAALFAQQALAQSGSIAGTVTDPSGATVEGTSVELQSRVTGYDKTVATDATATFSGTHFVSSRAYTLQLGLVW